MSKKEIAARMYERMTRQPFYVFGNYTTIDEKGVAREKDGTLVWEFEPGEFEGKTTQEIAKALETIFWYDRDIMTSGI